MKPCESNMTIVERRTNYPNALGRLNLPDYDQWAPALLEKLEKRGSVIGGMVDRTMLPQRDMSIVVEDDLRSRLNQQLTSSPIFPLIDRPKPLIDFIKERSPIVPRKSLLGAFGLVGQTTRNIPRPFQKVRIDRTRNLTRFPSAVGSDVSGPFRGIWPSKDYSKRMSIVM